MALDSFIPLTIIVISLNICLIGSFQFVRPHHLGYFKIPLALCHQFPSNHNGKSSTSSRLYEATNSAQQSPSLFWPNSNLQEGRDDNNDDDEEEEEDSRYNDKNVFDSIIKIYASHTEPSFLIPWQKKHQSSSTSSGFVISGKRIMTNAHSVEYASIVQVQRRGGSQKYRAIVEAIANECDLALLRVESDEFWDNLPTPPLEFGELPEMQDEVEVLGYPTGGDAMSVTSGVVSRIEMNEYAQSGMNLLAMQIDAAINAGNSGGPVVDMDGRVVGVAFQSLEQAENIGYAVPVTVVQHFLEDIRRHGKYSGFCCLGTRLAHLENPSQRALLKLDRGSDEGVLVSSVNPTSYVKGLLQPDDVILSLDGIPVSKDGNIPFRPGERVSSICYIQTKFVGDSVAVKVQRDGKRLTVDIPVSLSISLVPSHFHNKPPPYLILGGFVFTALSTPYLEAMDAWSEYVNDQISYLLTKVREPLEEDGDQVVVLNQVLAHSTNLGYEHMSDLHLIKFNGQKVRSLKQLHQLVVDCQEEFITLEFAPNGRQVVLEASTIPEATKDICEEHYIQRPFLFEEDC